MCLKELLNIFRKPNPDNSQYEPVPLTIPHPEESVSDNATMESVRVEMLRTAWYLSYSVPVSSYPFFDSLPISISQSPQFAWTIGSKIEVNPRYANPGVLAHEIAHVIYAKLTPAQKTEFEVLYPQLITIDPLMKLWSTYRMYWQTNATEAHSEIYRYLGNSMPESLKKFYPLLF